jgi:PhzF family phenazine biosynthesis protein
MEIPFYQIDAFTSRVFAGNPAGVCLLDAWPEDGLLQSIAAENNLSETAFLVARADGSYDLRWFTPKMEVDLCGHATLASAYLIFDSVSPSTSAAVFHTKSGMLSVARQGDLLVMDFPTRPPEPVEPPTNLAGILGLGLLEVLASSRDLFVVLEKEDQVRRVAPDLAAVAALDDYLGLIITARGESADFVSRFFAPRAGIPEDPVTGSAHCTLVPYWSKRLGKKRLHALQVSARGGELFCVDEGARVLIGGKAATYLTGKITV